MLYVLLVLLIVLIDQGSKWIVKANMELGESIPVLENIFHLTYSVNPGAAFGILAHRTTFFIVITVVLLILITMVIVKLSDRHNFFKLALTLQFGGAVGNLVDRMRTGYVVDFLDLRVWPIFNVADMAIVLGVIFIIYYIFFSPKRMELMDGLN